jgi:hypothetical protein
MHQAILRGNDEDNYVIRDNLAGIVPRPWHRQLTLTGSPT